MSNNNNKCIRFIVSIFLLCSVFVCLELMQPAKTNVVRTLPSFRAISSGEAPLKEYLINEEAIKEQNSQVLPMSIDLRAFDNPIQDQGAEPACTVYAMIAAMELLRNSHSETKVKYAEWRLWDVEKNPSISKMFKDLLNLAKYSVKISTIDGKSDNYQGIHVIFASLPDRLTLSGTHAVAEQVAQNFPVVFAIEVNESFEKNKYGWIEPTAVGTQRGHTVVVVGYKFFKDDPARSYFIIRNSWGVSWGDRGYGYLPLTYCKYHQCIAYPVKSVSWLQF